MFQFFLRLSIIYNELLEYFCKLGKRNEKIGIALLTISAYLHKRKAYIQQHFLFFHFSFVKQPISTPTNTPLTLQHKLNSKMYAIKPFVHARQAAGLEKLSMRFSAVETAKQARKRIPA